MIDAVRIEGFDDDCEVVDGNSLLVESGFISDMLQITIDSCGQSLSILIDPQDLIRACGVLDEEQG